jgi:plastocyanin
MRRIGIRLIPAVAAAVIGGALLIGGYARAGTPATGNTLGPGEVTVAITIHHSRFQPDHIRVKPGTTVRFVVDNQDPINHELIVGDAEVHRRHELGTEPVHPPRPGEVSIPASSRAETTFVFNDLGSVLYACHLPGHFRYGMSGYVDVAAR